MSDVFISYRREDKPRMEAVARALESLGLSVFFDARIPTGSVFDEVVADELRAARAVLVCWTPGAVDSRWVRSEAAFGLERGILLAAWFEPVTLTPPYNIVQAEDLQGWTGDLGDRNFQKVLERLGELVERPKLADEARSLALEAEWREKDSAAKAQFEARLSEARRMFEAQTRIRPVEFDARIAMVQDAYGAWLVARRLGNAGAMPDPMSAVESSVDALTGEVATLKRERDAAVAMAERAKTAGGNAAELNARLAEVIRERDAAKALAAKMREQRPAQDGAVVETGPVTVRTLVLRAAGIMVGGPIALAMLGRSRLAAIYIAVFLVGLVALTNAALAQAPATPPETPAVEAPAAAADPEAEPASPADKLEVMPSVSELTPFNMSVRDMVKDKTIVFGSGGHGQAYAGFVYGWTNLVAQMIGLGLLLNLVFAGFSVFESVRRGVVRG